MEMNADIVNKTLNEVIDAKIDDYVFKTSDGERAARANLARNFERFLKATI